MTDAQIIPLPKRQRKPPEPERKQPTHQQQMLDALFILRASTIMRECRKP